ncbi:MAG TPA: paraquat-inducible protein A [Burkholderiales bacterium]|nr:paraquat-inducible protein A [Burkholderiales bacterium]
MVEKPMAPPDSVLACDSCGLAQRVEPLEPGTTAECIRCGSAVVSRPFGTLEVTAALTLAALVLYVPANIYPLLSMNLYGTYTENTVWDGVVSLVNYNQYFIAAVVFLASILIPLIKLLGLLFLVWSVKFGRDRRMRGRSRIYKFIDVIGPWAMLDVFLVAILVALVKMGDLGRIIPGPGLIAFTAMVVLTILASQSFDPKAIWNKQ